MAVYFIILLVSVISLVGSPLLAQVDAESDLPNQENVESKKDASKDKPRTRVKRREKVQKQKQKMNDDYMHELSASLRYDSTSGKVKSADQTEDTKFSEQTIGASVGYGFLLNDNAEPIVEADYRLVTRKVADYSSDETILDVGLGILVNLPIVADGFNPESKSKFRRARWIPYFGFIVAATTYTDSRGTDTKDKVKDKDTVTKLVFGTRYMMFDHVAFNSSVRALYEESDSSAEDPDEQGATSSKITLEFRLLSLSLFF